METTTTLSKLLEIFNDAKGPERFRFAFKLLLNGEITMVWDLTKYCDVQENGFSVWMDNEEAKTFLKEMQD